jgi:hypothetical protein
LQHAPAIDHQLLIKRAGIVEVEGFQTGDAVDHGKYDKGRFAGRQVGDGAIRLSAENGFLEGVENEIVDAAENSWRKMGFDVAIS